MNYFIMVDDKFIDGIIEDAELVTNGRGNRYFIRGNKNKPRYVKNPKAEWIGNIWSKSFRKTLNSITPKDKIIIHWYDLQIGKLMLTIDKNIPLFVSLWGGDLYADPFPYHIDNICDSITLKYVKKTWGFPGNWPKNPRRILSIILYFLGFEKMINNEFDLKKKTVQRINYLLINPNTINELELVKKIYEIPKLKSKPQLVSQSLNIIDQLPLPKREKKAFVVQIGNSATESNNHIDCLEKLKRFKNKEMQFVIPLSYGSRRYANFVERKFNKEFNGKCQFIKKFLSRKEYYKELNNIDAAIMYTNISQAFENCIMLLALGKKVFLKKNNPLWYTFNRLGVKIFDANTIDKLKFEEFSKPLTRREKISNARIVSKIFSKKQQLYYMKQVLN